eukprot:7503088-Ditylum_brightwellii.AAC.1
MFKALGPVVKIGKQNGLFNINSKGLYGWPVNVIQALLEILSYCIPPACISANMLMIAEILFHKGIIAEDEIAQGTLDSIMCTFQQGRDLLQSWRD